MTPVPLHDQEARDRFQTALDENFCVSAGAGAGKTTAIVRRIAELARRDPEALTRLVVVTYTKSAAEELRSRARALLLHSATGEGSRLLPRFRQAFFGTIHSFCLSLVREFGAQLGVAPDTEVLDGDDDEDVWARYCESPVLDAVPLDREALDAVTRFLSFDELLRLARKIDPARAARLLARDGREVAPPLHFTKALAADGGKNPKAKQSTLEHQETLRNFLADLSDGAAFLRIPDFNSGSKVFLEAYEDEMFSFASWLDRQAARIAAGISLGYRDFRREQRLMTYADQIAWCRSLLDAPEVLEELRRRDSIVLLDEAQDTDAAMFAILSEITRPAGMAVGEWPEKSAVGPRPGRFSFVGDEQQSIFASRANLGVYRKYIDAYGAGIGGERLEFSVTMRCPRQVIGVVNAVFYQADRLQQTYFSFRELHPKPDCAKGAAWLLPIEPLPEEKPKVESAFREECRQVAIFLNAQGRAGLGVEKWSDVAVLCPRKAWLSEAAEIFAEAGLPCRLVSQRRLQAEMPERSWPAALLHVLVNPWDRFELIGVLREIFAVSDVELADAQAENKPFTFWSERGLSPRLGSALGLLRELHAALPPAGALSLGQYVERVVEATRLVARLEAIGQPSGAVRELRREALRAEIEGVPVRAWVEQLVGNLQRAAPVEAEGEDEILMMTSQKAKGSEWSGIIPLGCARPIKKSLDHYPRVEVRGDETVVHVSKVTVTDDEEEPRDNAWREEIVRLFYVTLTRAKSLLVLPDTRRLYKTSKDSFADLCRWDEIECGEIFDAITAPASGGDGLRDKPGSRD
jgi:ATP-dependent exoDNAse (exonuclease V) beta subunit